MRFKPKFIPPDDPPVDENGELKLPAELARLGERLQDEAVQLAKAYPAESLSRGKYRRSADTQSASRDTNHTPARSGSGASVATTLAFVAVTLVASCVFVFISARQNLGRVEEDNVARPVESANVDHATGPRANKSVETRIAAESETRHQPPKIDVLPRGTSPTVLLRDASGPEREGLLDLLELDEVAPHGKISI